MKKVKLIYFPVITLLIVVFAVLSFVHVSDAGSKNGVSNAYVTSVSQRTTELAEKRMSSDSTTDQDTVSEVRSYIASELSGFKEYNWTALTSSNKPIYDENGKDTGETYNLRYYRNDEQRNGEPWYIQQRETINASTLAAMDSTFGEDDLYLSAGKTINNIVVTIPGAKTRAGDRTADAILVVAHIDPAQKSPSSEDAASNVMIATFLEEIERLVTKDEYYENDVVFLFADSRYDSSFGVYAFMNQFVGIRNSSNDTLAANAEEHAKTDLVNRIKFAVNFDSMGTGDSSMLVATTENNNKLISKYSDIMGGSFSSSFVSDMLGSYQSDFDALKGLNSFNLVTFGNLENNNSAGDTMKNLGKDQISDLAAKKGTMLNSILKNFGDAKLDSLNGSKDVVYFSVMGLFTVSYTNIVSYVLAVITFLIFVLAIVINIFKGVNEKKKGSECKECCKKAFSSRAMMRGALLQIIAIAAAVASAFVIYFAMAAILSGFGVFTFQSITLFTRYNPGLIIGFTLLFAGLLGLFYSLFKNLFAVKATDTVRGGAALFIIMSAVLGFVYPALAYAVLLPAMLAAMVMLITVVGKGRFKEKHGQDIERLMLYLIPVLFALPLMLPVVCILASLKSLVLFPLFMLPIILLLSMVAPYIAALKPAFSCLMEKLPKHTIRVKKLVTEQVEDPAKKGKFSTVTHYVVKNEKVSWKYRHGALMAVIAVISAVIIMISASLTVPVGASVYGLETDSRNHITSTLFDDSFIISYRRGGLSTSAGVTSLEIHDKAMYKHVRYALSGYDWDGDKDAYSKTINANLLVPTASASGGGNRITVKPTSFAGMSGITEVTIVDAASIEQVTVYSESGSQILKMDNAEQKDNITVRLPLNSDDNYTLEMTYVVGNTNATGVTVVVKQYIWFLQSNLSDLHLLSGDFARVRDHFNDNEASRSVHFGMYFENELGLTYSL